MKIFKLTLITLAFVLFNTANASLVILSSFESGSSVSSVSSSLISGRGSSSSSYCDKTNECFEAYTSYFTVNFDVIGSQFISVNAYLNSSGTDYGNQSYIRLFETSLNQTVLGAISQAEASSVEGDDWVTDYAVGSLNIERQFFLIEGNYSLTAAAYEDSLNGIGDAYYSFTVTTVPVPAAVWLFGTGLIGLAGFARRKKA